MQSIYDLTAPTGRLGRQRQAVLDGIAKSKYLELEKPMGAFYAFVGARPGVRFDDVGFAMALLERQHVLVVPGSSFNVDYKTHFRMTFLPDEETLATVMGRFDALLAEHEF